MWNSFYGPGKEFNHLIKTFFGESKMEENIHSEHRNVDARTRRARRH